MMTYARTHATHPCTPTASSQGMASLELQELSGPPTKARASSVLNRNVREFGVSNLFDGNPDTCWNSAQGSPQWILLQFHRPVVVSTVRLMFQGGFAGKEVEVSVVDAAPPAPAPSPPPATPHAGDPTAPKAAPRTVATFFPDDDNSTQSFDVGSKLGDSARAHGVVEMRLSFPSSTDFYGRITLYQLAVLGREVG